MKLVERAFPCLLRLGERLSRRAPLLVGQLCGEKLECLPCALRETLELADNAVTFFEPFLQLHLLIVLGSRFGDLGLRQTARRAHRDVLLATRCLIERGHLHDAVHVDLENNFDLRYTFRGRRDIRQHEAAERRVLVRHRAFALKYGHLDFVLVVGDPS